MAISAGLGRSVREAVDRSQSGGGINQGGKRPAQDKYGRAIRPNFREGTQKTVPAPKHALKGKPPPRSTAVTRTGRPAGILSAPGRAVPNQTPVPQHRPGFKPPQTQHKMDTKAGGRDEQFMPNPYGKKAPSGRQISAQGRAQPASSGSGSRGGVSGGSGSGARSVNRDPLTGNIRPKQAASRKPAPKPQAKKAANQAARANLRTRQAAARQTAKSPRQLKNMKANQQRARQAQAARQRKR